ncbi:hypothetical protein BBJ28_00015915, partial [Nothophytophthora sp. Chile5]
MITRPLVMDAATVVLWALPCLLVFQASSKALLPPRTTPRYRDALPIWTLAVGSRESRSPAGVVVASPDLIEDVLQTNADSYGKGEYLSGNLRDLMGDGIFAAGSPKWFRQRKTASNLFSMRDSMAVMVQDSMPVLQRFFEKAEASGEPLDLFPLFNRFTLETFTEIVFGIKFGALNTGE